MLTKILGTTGTRLLNALLTLLTLWITTNYLGKEGVGTISLIILDISIILLLNDFLGGSALVYFSSRKKLFSLLLVSYSWAIVVLMLFFFIFRLMALFPGIYSDIVATGYEHHILLLAFMNALCLSNYNFLVGLEKIKRYNQVFSLQIVTTAIVLALMIFVFRKHEVMSYVIALYVALGLSILTSFGMLFKNIKVARPEKPGAMIKEILAFGSMGQFANIIQLMNKRFSFFVIKSHLNVGALGVYSAGVQLTEGLRIIGQSISLVQFSRISNTRDPEYAKRISIQLLKFTLFVTLIALLVILAIPSSVFTYVFGEDFGGLKPVILSLSIGLMAISASMIFAHYFSGMGKPKYNMYSSAWGLLITIPGVFILIPWLGIIGAGLAASAAYLASMIYHLILFVKMSGAKGKEFLPGKDDWQVLRTELRKMVKTERGRD
ncbi:MAG: oligosaccharide flippase family protein [Bacteroidales bacterium]|nr:oligosaccharide flippase family protein [Bacteroidales bacterium]MCF8351844.1 oligosaccharide flippase family protein [Bacteroidales bacterium]MCF8375263.1 oligosaccharide flippase family protein [Bacteroidales bacterium]MCF8401263.1 oligosaccharide flippase family protein [Bacteroidales bacterium]